MDGKEIAAALGKVVRQLRTERGYSQENFAYHAGLHRTFMGMIERGQRNVTIQTVFRLAEGLDMPPAQLIDAVSKELSS